MKTKSLKKLMALSLAIMLLVTVPAQAFVVQDDAADVSSLIIQALQGIEPLKEDIGFGDIDFTTLAIGNPIHAYDLTEEGLCFLRLVHPLFENEELVALGLEVNFNGTTRIQITRSLVDEINEKVDSTTPFALIYQYDGCYLYTENNILQIARCVVDEPTDITSLSFDATDAAIDLSSICLSTLDYKYDIQYQSNPVPHVTNSYYSCKVPYVSQGSNEYICWAASAACIVNYLCGDTLKELLTAESVAKWYWKTDDISGIEHGAYDLPLMNNLNTTYKIGYHAKDSCPNDEIIIKNLKGDYPLYAVFRYYDVKNGTDIDFENEGRTHACVIHAINTNAGYISVMDPWEPSGRPHYETAEWIPGGPDGYGGYGYLNPNGKKLLFLERACYHYE